MRGATLLGARCHQSREAGTDLSNYDITYAEGTLTVTTAPLTITAHDQSKAYGEAFVFTGTEFDTMGLQDWDEVTSVTQSSDGAAVDAELGIYPIVASDAVGTGLVYYEISYVDGTLTVTPGPASLLVFVSEAQELVAGVCSQIVTLETHDGHGNASEVEEEIVVGLSSDSSTMSFFSDEECETEITNVTLEAGESEASFYFWDRTAGGPVVTADASPDFEEAAEQTQTIVPGPASRVETLLWAVDSEIPADGATTTTIFVQARDAYGNYRDVGADAVVLATTAGSLGAVTDHGNGTYTAMLTSSTVAGEATITGTINGEVIGDSAVVTFVYVDLPVSIEFISGHEGAMVAHPVDPDIPHVFEVFVQDDAGPLSLATVHWSWDGAAGGASFDFASTDTWDGYAYGFARCFLPGEWFTFIATVEHQSISYTAAAMLKCVCADDSQCPVGHECVTGDCIESTEPPEPECTTDDDCYFLQVCAGEVCIYPQQPTCLNDADCSWTQACVEGSCVDPPMPTCLDDAHCPSEHICRHGQCLQSCTEHDDCPQGRYCDRELCMEYRDTDGDGIWDHLDNCPWVYNPDQQNSSPDPANNPDGDACAFDRDSDDDGLSDAFEVWLGSDPADPYSIDPQGQLNDGEAFNQGMLPNDDPEAPPPERPRTALWHASLSLNFHYRRESGDDFDEVTGKVTTQFALYRPAAAAARLLYEPEWPPSESGIYSLPMGIRLTSGLPPGIDEIYGVLDGLQYKCGRQGGVDCSYEHVDEDQWLRWALEIVEGELDATSGEYRLGLKVANTNTIAGRVEWTDVVTGEPMDDPSNWYDALKPKLRDPSLSCPGDANTVLSLPRAQFDRAGSEPLPTFAFYASNDECEQQASLQSGRVTMKGFLDLTPIHMSGPEDVERGTDRRPNKTQFAYDDSPEGRLVIPHALSFPKAPGLEKSLKDAMCWRMPRIGTADDSITTEFTGGAEPSDDTAQFGCTDAARHRVGVGTAITYVGLPDDYTSFGRQMSQVRYLGKVIDSINYDVAFNKSAHNHPGPANAELPDETLGRRPNGYYYYIQSNVPPSYHRFTYHPDRCITPEGVRARACFLASSCLDGWHFANMTEISFTTATWDMQLLPFAALSEHEQDHFRFLVEVIWENQPYNSAQAHPNHSCIRSARVDAACSPGEDVMDCFRRHAEPPAEAAQAQYCTSSTALRQLDYAAPGPNWKDGSHDSCPW